jgi:hypothetical protein
VNAALPIPIGENQRRTAAASLALLDEALCLFDPFLAAETLCGRPGSESKGDFGGRRVTV